MDFSRRSFLVSSTAALGALAAGPVRAADAALIAAAKSEGSGMAYSVVDPVLMQAVVKGFTDKYGIGIEIVRLTSGALGQRLTAEVESGRPVADLVIDTDRGLIQAMTARGYYAPISTVPGAEKFPESARTATSIIAGRVPYSVIWNTHEVKEAPKSWQILLDPKWAGRVMVIDPRLGVSPCLWHVLMRKTYGDDFIRALGKAATLSPSAVPGMQQVAAGAQAFYAPAVHQITVGLTAKGAPIQEAFLEPTISSDNLLSIMAKPPHPNIAKLFAEFCLSMEGQALLNNDGFSLLAGVPNTRPMPNIQELDPALAKQQLPEILSLLGVG